MTNGNKAHMAQGRTFDTGHLVCLGVARDQLYVGMSQSRGQEARSGGGTAGGTGDRRR